MNHGRDDSFRPTLTETVEAVQNAPSAEEAVFLLRDTLSLVHVTFHMNVTGAGPLDYPFVRTTYSPQWISRYVLQGYLRVDPILRVGFSATQPFAWHEVQMDEREKALMADARAHGVGAEGYCVPVIDRFSRRSILSFSSDMEREAWIAFISRYATVAVEAAHVLHQKAISELSLDTPALAALAPREAECLLWTARGKDAKAIAAILGLSEFTVRSYLRTARQKLHCRTLSQAVAKAIQQRIINP
jgi:DNA-binding CsgD family transcriptional regulator